MVHGVVARRSRRDGRPIGAEDRRCAIRPLPAGTPVVAAGGSAQLTVAVVPAGSARSLAVALPTNDADERPTDGRIVTGPAASTTPPGTSAVLVLP